MLCSSAISSRARTEAKFVKSSRRIKRKSFIHYRTRRDSIVSQNSMQLVVQGCFSSRFDREVKKCAAGKCESVCKEAIAECIKLN
jgi:hypothetical protein